MSYLLTPEELSKFIKNLSDEELMVSINIFINEARTRKLSKEVSDGYHSFMELYAHRMALTALLLKDPKYKAVRSLKHSDGTMFDNSFIVVFYVKERQCSYHYGLDLWDTFDFLPTVEKAPEYSGHTSGEVVLNLLMGLSNK